MFFPSLNKWPKFQSFQQCSTARRSLVTNNWTPRLLHRKNYRKGGASTSHVENSASWPFQLACEDFFSVSPRNLKILEHEVRQKQYNVYKQIRNCSACQKNTCITKETRMIVRQGKIIYFTSNYILLGTAWPLLGLYLSVEMLFSSTVILCRYIVRWPCRSLQSAQW